MGEARDTLKPVIVIGGSIQGLAVVRSLGWRGVPVVLADDSRLALAWASRFVKARIKLPDPVESELAFVEAHCEKRTAPLCGNSVHTDRAFLWRHMRRLHDHLHYRNVDVSTVKELLRRWFPDRYDPPAKAGRHEARSDIHESIEELRYYRRTFLS